MSTNLLEISEHLTTTIIEGINAKNVAAVESDNLNSYKPIDVQDIVKIYGTLYRGIKKQIKEDN